MEATLKPSGRIAVSTHDRPDGPADLAARLGTVPEVVFGSLRFGTDVLEQWFREDLTQSTTDHFHNEVTLPSYGTLV